MAQISEGHTINQLKELLNNNPHVVELDPEEREKEIDDFG